MARARADLQGTAGESEGQGPLVDRVSRLSAAADRRRRDVRRASRSGRGRSGRAPGTGARGRAALQQLLRPGAGGARTEVDELRAPARPRRRQEDEQEPRQHHPSVGQPGRSGEKSPPDVHGSEENP